MVARILATGAALLLAVFGFFENPVNVNPLAPLGIVFLLVSGVIWFAWDMIQDAYAYREEIAPNSGRAYLQTVRLGPVFVSRLVRKNTE